jgi:hypothetical protein
LISNALSRGQKVLLVCQKKYALDVVFERLDKVGLSKHVAPLYDGKDRSLLCKKVSSILDTRTDYGTASIIKQKFNNYSGTIILSRSFGNKILGTFNMIKSKNAFQFFSNKLLGGEQPIIEPPLVVWLLKLAKIEVNTAQTAVSTEFTGRFIVNKFSWV